MELNNPALIIVDVQKIFKNVTFAERNNLDAESKIVELLSIWRKRSLPIIHIRHLSNNEDLAKQEGLFTAKHAVKRLEFRANDIHLEKTFPLETYGNVLLTGLLALLVAFCIDRRFIVSGFSVLSSSFSREEMDRNPRNDEKRFSRLDQSVVIGHFRGERDRYQPVMGPLWCPKEKSRSPSS
ncbi:hypothetical protein ACFOU2_17135 [Bacillus songklensis]|uniref:Isochorismatase-like domain-containing protein n=1 Tax=Bacillus songklensis TaxID=1069116 RepID=A0ABV8B632_9BACI